MFQGLQQEILLKINLYFTSRALRQCLLIFTIFPPQNTLDCYGYMCTSSGCWKHLQSKSRGKLLWPGPWVPLPGCACWCSLLLPVQPAVSCHAPSTHSWRAASPKDSAEEARIWKFWLSTRGQFVNISCGLCSFPRPALWLQPAFPNDHLLW